MRYRARPAREDTKINLKGKLFFLIFFFRFSRTTYAMGLSSTKLNCLVLGLDGVGKTTILYGMRLEETNKTFKETVGFNYEIINQVYKGKRFELHMWDLAGKKEVG